MWEENGAHQALATGVPPFSSKRSLLCLVMKVSARKRAEMQDMQQMDQKDFLASFHICRMGRARPPAAHSILGGTAAVPVEPLSMARDLLLPGLHTHQKLCFPAVLR